MVESHINLSRVSVRQLTEPLEKDRWKEYMEEFHPQGWSGMVGEQLYYIAVDENDNWLACLGWSAAARKLSDREGWIGWTRVQMRQRLHLLANNARFLILPGHEQANLGSRILGLNVRILSDDWKKKYGHPIWMVETFVEYDRLGSCYKASGWEEVGSTKGFRRVSQDGYRKHGLVKRYFAREIRKGTRKKFAGRAPLAEDWPLSQIEPAALPLAGDAASARPSLQAVIEKHVLDCRKARGQRYKVSTILGLLILGVLAGKKNVKEISVWAHSLSDKHRRELGCLYINEKRGRPVPSANTYRYVLQDLETDQLETVLLEWCHVCDINTRNTQIAVDGKVLRGSRRDDIPAVVQVNAFDVDKQMIIDQRAVPRTTTETVTVRDVLERHDLTGTIVSADAAHCNNETAQCIQKKTDTFSSKLKAISLSFATK